MPVGTNGKAMLLLSGGIDSPVAGYMISKRGVIIEAVYFLSLIHIFWSGREALPSNLRLSAPCIGPRTGRSIFLT